jgi:capsular polysaccharide transport system permease protein
MNDSILRAFRIQARVIWALMMRELQTRYGRENIGFLWIVGEPAFFAIGVTILWSLVRSSHEHGIPIIGFTLTGYIPLLVFRHCVNRSVRAFESNGSLLYHRQVTLFDCLAARLILEVYGSIATYILVAGGCMLVGLMNFPVDFGLFYLGWFYMILFSVGSGLILATLSEISETMEKLVPIFSYLYLPFSGAFTMVDWLPPKFQTLLLYSPGQNAVEMIRGGQFGAYIHPHYDVVYVTSVCVIMILVGMSLTLRARRFVVIGG